MSVAARPRALSFAYRLAHGLVGALVGALALTAPTACVDGQGSPEPLPILGGARPAFDGEAAHLLVREQVEFGPRIPGTEGHAAQLSWMLARLAATADELTADTFEVEHTQTGERLTLTNVLARFRPDAERRLLFLAHWDTRPRSDAGATVEERAIPVPGANDGGSGTAILLQVAEHLAAEAPPVGIDLLLVDGEDYGPTTDDMFLGAKRYAATSDRSTWPVYAVLLDMVGDTDPRFPIEGYSAQMARDVAQRVWRVAASLGYGAAFPPEVGRRVSDDHVPLNEAGLPTVDIIDLEYGPGNAYWHTPEDLPDRTSAATLGMVGELVLELIYMGG